MPSAPPNVKVKHITKDGVTICWKPAKGNGKTIRRYNIYMQTAPHPAYVEQANPRVKELITTKDGYEYRLNKLRPGSKLKFKVVGTSSLGVGVASEATKEIQPTPTPPDAPLLKPLFSDVGPDSLMLTWEPPKYDNGAPVIGYRITVQEGGNGGFVEKIRNTGSPATQQKITGLKHGGYTYEFKVQAINKIGVGKQTKASSPAITTYDKKKAATTAITDHLGVEKIDEVRNQRERAMEANVIEKHKAKIAVDASRHAKFVATQANKLLARCKRELKHQKKMTKRKLDVATKVRVRELAVLRRMSKTKAEAEKSMTDKKMFAAQETIKELHKSVAARDQKNTKLDRKNEALEAKIVAMMKTGCKLGIKSWCVKR